MEVLQLMTLALVAGFLIGWWANNNKGVDCGGDHF
jgi:hypothetical protein